MNGGGNYNRPKVQNSRALVKLDHMRETPRTAMRYSFALVQAVKSRMDMGTIRREDSHMTDTREPSETLRPASSQRLTAQWICGFVDGEGNFFVDINPYQEMTSGFQVLPEFTVVQHERDVQLLYALKKFFRCGVVRQDHGDHMCYRVRSVEHLIERIVPFFEKHELRSKKRVDFIKFRRILLLMERGLHLTTEGIAEIRVITEQRNIG